MKYCNEYAPLLSAFVDGELTAAEREQVLAHLDECEACRGYLAELTAMHAAFGEFAEVDVPAGFAAGVMARAKQSGRVAKKVSRRRRFAPLAACAAALLFVTVTALPWLGGAGKAESAAPQAPGMQMADMTAKAEEAIEAPAAPAPEAAEEYFYHTQNSINFAAGAAEKSADQETVAETEAPAPGSSALDDLEAMRAEALVLRGLSAETYLKGWGSKVDDGLYCIDPALLKRLPVGLSLSPEDEAKLYASQAPFVYIVAEVSE